MTASSRYLHLLCTAWCQWQASVLPLPKCFLISLLQLELDPKPFGAYALIWRMRSQLAATGNFGLVCE